MQDKSKRRQDFDSLDSKPEFSGIPIHSGSLVIVVPRVLDLIGRDDAPARSQVSALMLLFAEKFAGVPQVFRPCIEGWQLVILHLTGITAALGKALFFQQVVGLPVRQFSSRYRFSPLEGPICFLC